MVSLRTEVINFLFLFRMASNLWSFLDEFIFPMTIHPDVSGRPHVLLMHERIIEHINKHEGVRWVTMAEVNSFLKRYLLVPVQETN